jgi:hypothetical protein
MTTPAAPTRRVRASDLRAWMRWLSAHYDPAQDSPQNTELHRLGRTLEALGRHAGAIGSAASPHGTTAGETGEAHACLLDAFDWEQGEIEICLPHLLRNRLGSPDPEAFIARLVAVTGIPEHVPEEPSEPEYVV